MLDHATPLQIICGREPLSSEIKIVPHPSSSSHKLGTWFSTNKTKLQIDTNIKQITISLIHPGEGIVEATNLCHFSSTFWQKPRLIGQCGQIA